MGQLHLQMMASLLLATSIADLLVVDLNVFRGFVEALEEILILHLAAVCLLPAIILPVSHPFGVALDDVIRIGANRHLVVAAITSRLDGMLSSRQIGPVVGLATVHLPM